MSAWRGEALKQFPELQEKILKAESHEEVWNSVKAAYKDAVEAGQTDFVTGVLKFAVFFLRSRAQAANAVAEARIDSGDEFSGSEAFARIIQEE